MKITLRNADGDRKTIAAIDFTQAWRDLGWVKEGEYLHAPSPDPVMPVEFVEPTPEEIEEFNEVHPALALLNGANASDELEVLPSVGTVKASKILAERVMPWDTLETAAEDLEHLNLDWDAIEKWGA